MTEEMRLQASANLRLENETCIRLRPGNETTSTWGGGGGGGV